VLAGCVAERLGGLERERGDVAADVAAFEEIKCGRDDEAHDRLQDSGLGASVLVGLLNDLEGEGLVERVRDPADRRRHIVDVSDLGTKTLMKLNAEIDDLSRQLFGAISATDIETLRRSLSAVCTNDRDGSNTGCA
jgi:DNA-binding MarR family transcriptional regulator